MPSSLSWLHTTTVSARESCSNAGRSSTCPNASAAGGVATSTNPALGPPVIASRHAAGVPTNRVRATSRRGGASRAINTPVANRSPDTPIHTSSVVTAYCSRARSTPRVHRAAHIGIAVASAHAANRRRNPRG